MAMLHPLTENPVMQWDGNRAAVQWRCTVFDKLSVHTLYDILRLRVDVFVVEQNCPYPEVDGEDQTALHIQGYSAPGLMAYARVLPPDENDHIWIGRVIVAQSARGYGLGADLMRHAMSEAETAYPGREQWLGAQVASRGFYEASGFEVSGEEYLEDDILHVPMRRCPI